MLSFESVYDWGVRLKGKILSHKMCIMVWVGYDVMMLSHTTVYCGSGKLRGDNVVTWDC